MVPGFVYESGTDQIRSESIPQLIFGLAYLLILTRFIWPLQLPLSIKILVAALALVALQFHRWSKLSSGSVFSPEFPRLVVVLFNWSFGAIVLLALLQLLLDVGLLVEIPIHGGIVSAPNEVRYGFWLRWLPSRPRSESIRRCGFRRSKISKSVSTDFRDKSTATPSCS